MSLVGAGARHEGEEGVVAAPEPLQAEQAPALVEELERAGRGGRPVKVDMGKVRTVDTFGLAALACGIRGLRQRGVKVEVVSLDEQVEKRAKLQRMGEVLAPAEKERSEVGLFERGIGVVNDFLDAVVVLFAMLWDGFRFALLDCFRSSLGREHLARQLDQVGLRGIPIVAGVTFMIGAIMAVQTAYVVEAYGGTMWVARGLAVSMTREIGPLMAALLVAGRSGSAIAAELGSMVVSDETEALEMMALEPRRFLLSPRFVALTFAVPSLSMLANVCGVIGGMIVMNLGYQVATSTYYDSTIQAVYFRDVFSGLIKSVFFGALIAVVACRRGLGLRGGPEAVGQAATSAVVEGILVVVLFDTAFTIATRQVL